MAKTVVGLMDGMRAADQVVRDLESASFDKGSINVLGSNRGAGTTTGPISGTPKETTASVRGLEEKEYRTESGGLGGYQAGFTPITIPGIGPALARGPLFNDLAGGGTGPLVKLGVPEQDAGYYLEGVKRGAVLVAVTCPDDQAPQALSIMEKRGAIDVERMAGQWRKQGWTGFRTEGHRESSQSGQRLQEERIIPVAEESVKVGKREVAEGVVRVYTHVESVPVRENIQLREEHATIERRPVDRPVSQADDAFKDTSVEIREMREEPVVSKEARVKEEVVVGKESSQRMETVQETARQTRLEVDRSDETRSATAGRTGFDEDEEFRRHYQGLYGSKGGNFDTYRSAYHYADDPEATQLRGREWSEVEDDVHRSWDRKHPGGTWNEVKEAIRYGWNKKRH